MVRVLRDSAPAGDHRWHGFIKDGIGATGAKQNLPLCAVERLIRESRVMK